MGGQYRRIPILDTARRCGLILDEATLNREEVAACCPFCGDNGPGKHHLFLNTRRDQYHCVLCGAGGNSVSLYARLEGVSNWQAYQDLCQTAKLYPFPEHSRPGPPREPEPGPLWQRHQVYSAMLAHLKLSPQHHAALLERGLSEERIRQNGYRTLPKSFASRRLLAGLLAGFYPLEGIPGFFEQDGRWTLAGRGGLLIPCRDQDGHIQGLQIRLDDAGRAERKYRWLSSRGLKRGTRGRSCIHITGDTRASTAYLTEGLLKGDVSSCLDHDALFVCFAGVNAVSGLRDELAGLEQVDEVVLALDMDKLTNWRVRRAAERIAETVRSIPGIRVRTMDWNLSFKGVDDYYKARREAAARGVNILDMRSNFITRYLEERWREAYPRQDRGFIHACEWEEAVIPLHTLKCAPLEPEPASPSAYEDLDAPLVCVNGVVIDGQRRWQALRLAGQTAVRVYQNRPWALPAAA